jgi:hypothetical protein
MQSTRIRKCKIGNWQEEMAFELDKKAMVAKARQQAELTHTSKSRSIRNDEGAAGAGASANETRSNISSTEFFKMANTAATNIASLSAQIFAKRQHHLQETQLATSCNGFVRFGVPIMLQNEETQGTLAVDIHDKSGAGKNLKIVATTSSSLKPTLRNTWIILPVAEDILNVQLKYKALGKTVEDLGYEPTSILHYGQRFVICSLDDMQVVPGPNEEPNTLLLASEARTPQTQAKRSTGQEVYYTPYASQKTWWTAVHANPDFRLDMEYAPVKANTLFLVRHQITAVPLASTKVGYPNDFGAEYEVCAHRHTRVQVRNGNALETPANFWQVVTADK